MATRLKEVEPEQSLIQPGRALGYSITANLGDDRQIVVQCFADNDDPLKVIHQQLDKAMAVVDRQKAKYKKIEVEKNVEEMERTLRRLKADLNEAEVAFERKLKEIDGQLLDVVKARDEAQQRFNESGRAAPVGADKGRIPALKAEGERLNGEREKALEERKLGREHAATNIKRFEEEIAKARAQIDECVALIEGG
jgi:predicted  nucleic acid-binding Zn-ribbon protein